jgi:CRP-like cAMP-binding protein
MNATAHPHAGPQQNHLLAALPSADWVRWQPYLHAMELKAGQLLCEPGWPLAHAYFPTTAVVSLLCMTEDGESTEIAVVGNDGVVGLSLFVGGMATPGQAVVQSAGQVYRLDPQAIAPEVSHGGPVFNLMKRYSQALMTQIAQTAVCNRHHTVDQQLCRRLLVSLDRSPSDELEMTHELTANLLGVRRETVTSAAHKLQQAGLIRYGRGHIAVCDREQLERRTCECYAVVRKEYDRLRPLPFAA